MFQRIQLKQSLSFCFILKSVRQSGTFALHEIDQPFSIGSSPQQYDPLAAAATI